MMQTDELLPQQNKKPNQDALLAQLTGGDALSTLPAQGGNTGVSGVMNAPGGLIPPVEASQPEASLAAPKNYKSVGQYGSALAGFDSSKLNSEHDSPKYQIARALSHFDPKQGLTPEALDALNGLGIGTFSSDGNDGLSVEGGDPRFEGLSKWDAIGGYARGQGGDPKWQFGVDGARADGSAYESGPSAPGAPMGGGGGMGTPDLNALLTGDPLSKIQAGIGKYMPQQQNLQALLAQLGA